VNEFEPVRAVTVPHEDMPRVTPVTDWGFVAASLVLGGLVSAVSLLLATVIVR
jgi:hypothetical protein